MDKLVLRPGDIEDLIASDLRNINLEENPSWTLIGKTGEYVACFGIVHHEKINNISASWLLGSKHLKNYKKTLVKEVLRKQNEYKDKTLVTLVIKSHLQSQRWLEFLGYEMREEIIVSGIKKILFIRKAQ